MARQNRIYFFLLLIALVIFIILKIPALSLPYFWDELGVYTRAAAHLTRNGMGLAPRLLPPDLSRGHPLLFSFIYACWFKLFGLYVMPAHILALAISVGLLVSLYYITARISRSFLGLGACVLLIAQPIFFAQSVMVLPEVIIALLSLWCLYFYYRRHYLLFALCASAAMLIKESAVTIPVAVLAWTILTTIAYPQVRNRINARALTAIGAPLFVYALFLVVQKQQNGWYFFPYHMDQVSFNLKNVYHELNSFYKFLFYSQGRNQWIIILIVALALLLLKARLKTGGTFGSLVLVFALVYLVFCSVNFYMNRYLLAVFPVVIILLVLALDEIWTNNYFIAITIMLLTLSSALKLTSERFDYDCSMAYKNVLAVEQQAANFMATNVKNGTKIRATFPMHYVLFETNTGFNIPPYILIQDTKTLPDYLVEDKEVDSIALNRENYLLLKKFQCGFAGVKISKLK